MTIKQRLLVEVYEIEDGAEYAGRISFGSRYLAYEIRFSGDFILNFNDIGHL